MAALVLCADRAAGQTPANPPSPAAAAPAASEDAAGTWSFSASVYSYLLPDEGNYGQPTMTADRGWLHLEGRYNYEDLDTGSAWIGYNIGGGDTLAWEVTPMIGGVFGSTDGIAPGAKGSLSWWKLELYSEGEYVFDLGESADSFFYNWSELTIAPVSWLRAGMVTQRTRVYETDRDIQRGILVGFLYKALSFTTYVFNPDDSKPIVVLGAAVTF
ncbi:MAG TPA: hypothetical protein VFV95_02430 [Vicinamibacterales bacterium]|nr:hypothetical protein [Vicinamibacterales bacterium]